MKCLVTHKPTMQQEAVVYMSQVASIELIYINLFK